MSSPPVSLRIPGVQTPLQLHVHGQADRFVSRRIREEGIWEPYETTLVLAALQPGDVFVDVGANIGYFPVIAAGRVGSSGAVLAFEPDPDNYRLLQQHLAPGKVPEKRFPRFKPGLVSPEMGAPPTHAHAGFVTVIKGLVHPVVQDHAIDPRRKTAVR